LIQRCGYKTCCNSDHFEFITPTQYFVRVYEGIYPLPNGEYQQTEYDAREVFTVKMLRRARVPRAEIAREIGIPIHTVRRLESTTSWRHLEPKCDEMEGYFPLMSPTSPLGSISYLKWLFNKHYDWLFRDFLCEYTYYKPMIRPEPPTANENILNLGFAAMQQRRFEIVMDRIRRSRSEAQ
jgi:hypothetical protein